MIALRDPSLHDPSLKLDLQAAEEAEEAKDVDLH
jgi:hypothetical protein